MNPQALPHIEEGALIISITSSVVGLCINYVLWLAKKAPPQGAKDEKEGIPRTFMDSCLNIAQKLAILRWICEAGCGVVALLFMISIPAACQIEEVLLLLWFAIIALCGGLIWFLEYVGNELEKFRRRWQS